MEAGYPNRIVFVVLDNPCRKTLG